MVRVERLTDGPLVVLDPGGQAPVVSVHIWMNVGSAHEAEEDTGIAHFLEHMLFKGAGSHGVGEAITRVEALGGEINAWTSFESTVLHATVPAGREIAIIELLSDMAFRPHLDPVELERERKVVLEELREAQDSPGQVLANRQRALAWGEHPYGTPILGSVKSVGGLSRERMGAFHERYYRPSNSIVVIAGPVDADRVLDQVSRSMADSSESVERPERRVPSKVVSSGSFSFDGGFEESTVELVFRIPAFSHADIAALDLLAAVLGGGRNSILSKELRYELDCVLSCWAVLENDRDGGLFVVGIAPRRDRAAVGIEAMARLLTGLPEAPISDADLRRARAGVLRDRLLDAETVDGRASRLAWYQAYFGDPAASDLYEAAIRRVSVEDLRRVARTYLDLDHAVVGMVAPEGELDQAGLDSAIGTGRAHPVPAVTPKRRTTRHVLDNGLVLRCEPDPDAELVGISLMGLGGALAEGARMPGLRRAWSSLLCRGAGAMDTLELAAEVEERAGSISAWTGRNSMGVDLSFPVSELGTAIELLAILLHRPWFDPDEVERVRRDMVHALGSVEDDPDRLSWELAWAGLFPGHPWGRSSMGTPASAARLSPGRVRAFHRRVIQGSNLVMGVAGAVDPEHVARLLRRRLGTLPTGRRFQSAPPEIRERFRSRPRRRIHREGAPASLVIGFPGPGGDEPEGVVASVLAGILGGATGGAGRLFDELRERQGLAYSVGACAELGLGGGALMCTMTTDPERLEQARRGLWSELDRLLEDGVQAEELERVKDSLVDGAVLGMQGTSARADHLVAAEFHGEPGTDYRDLVERPRHVTADALHRLARALIRKDRSVEAIVAPC